jgi:hypothetical protein
MFHIAMQPSSIAPGVVGIRTVVRRRISNPFAASAAVHEQVSRDDPEGAAALWEKSEELVHERFT